jgi:hypothetical protein
VCVCVCVCVCVHACKFVCVCVCFASPAARQWHLVLWHMVAITELLRWNC